MQKNNGQQNEGLDQLGAAARQLQASPAATRQQQVVEQAVALLRPCDYAGLTMLVDGRVLSTAAATDGLVWQGDQAQYDLDQGPCLDAVRDQHTVVCQDLSRDERWPRWSPYVVQHLGVRSVLAVLLFTTERRYGALNLYSRQTNAFGDDEIVMAEALAATVALALASADEIEQRGTAMVNRTVIGQAQGILMERYDITDAAAFALLRRLSQSSNTKLITLALTLATTRNLAGLADGGSPTGILEAS